MDAAIDSSHDRDIKITISGVVVKPELTVLMAQVLQNPEYPEKHTLWDLTDDGELMIITLVRDGRQKALEVRVLETDGRHESSLV